MHKIIPTLTMAATLSVPIALVPTTAHADTAAKRMTLNYQVQTSRHSITGSIYHITADGKFISGTVVEVGEPERTLKARISLLHDKKVGLKVYQPAHTCLKVYSTTFGIIWFRVLKKQPVDYGRDVWITQGPGDDGRVYRTKILRPNREGQCP